jgi:hypothetical protein
MNIRVDTGAADLTPSPAGELQLILTLCVDDAEKLWNAAVQRCAQVAEGLTLDEIVETIGPREDPSIEDCIKMLALSSTLAGCTIADILICQAGQKAAAAETAAMENSEAHSESPPAQKIEVPHIFNHRAFNAIHGTCGAFHGIS